MFHPGKPIICVILYLLGKVMGCPLHSFEIQKGKCPTDFSGILQKLLKKYLMCPPLRVSFLTLLHFPLFSLTEVYLVHFGIFQCESHFLLHASKAPTLCVSQESPVRAPGMLYQPRLLCKDLNLTQKDGLVIFKSSKTTPPKAEDCIKVRGTRTQLCPTLWGL